QSDQSNRQNILNDENAENQLREPLLRLTQPVKGLDDDRGGRDRKYRPKKYAIHGAPAKKPADLIAEPDHEQNFQKRSNKCRAADLLELAQAKIQSEGKHQ